MRTYGTHNRYLLKSIDVSLIIYLLICNFIHTPFEWGKYAMGKVLEKYFNE